MALSACSLLHSHTLCVTPQLWIIVTVEICLSLKSPGSPHCLRGQSPLPHWFQVCVCACVRAHTHFAHWMKGQQSGNGSALKTAIHVSKRGALIGGQTEGLLVFSYSLWRARGERSREQQCPLGTMTPGPRMFFCWFLVVNSKALKKVSCITGHGFRLCSVSSSCTHSEAK